MAMKKSKDDVQTSGLKSRMESFYFELTAPDGKTTKIGSEQKSSKK
jgi:hypothetical protein